MEKEKKPLIILAGPTAAGKTALSLRLAHAVGGEIVSADSVQVYRHMDIGSAKIPPEEQDGIPHHLIDCLEPDEPFHVAAFQNMAKEAMRGIWERGRIPIVTGGTGFYIRALVYDTDFSEEPGNPKIRRELEHLAVEQGPEVLHAQLAEADPASAEAIHPHNVKRVIRALEYYKLNGIPISRHNEEERKKESPYRFAYFVLSDERSHLYERIDRRVDGMMEAGLLEEVKRLKDMGCTRDMVSMQGLGYKELLAYLEGEYPLEEAVRILKRDTRHFAKRQLTWFKREPDAVWICGQDYAYSEEVELAAVLECLREKGII